MTRWACVGALLTLTACGVQRCNPPDQLATRFPGTCTEAGTACTQRGFCEPCGHRGEVCCTGLTCGVDGDGTRLTCRPPPEPGGQDGLCQ